MKRAMCLGITFMLMLFFSGCGGSKVKSTSTVQTSLPKTQNLDTVQNTAEGNSAQTQKSDSGSTDSETVELYPVNVWGKYGYIDKKGSIVIKPQYTFAGAFKEGMAKVELDGKLGYIDRNGAEVIKPQYTEAYDFSEGLAAVRTTDGKTMYVDKKGNTVLSRADMMYPFGFSGGLAACGSNQSIGFMDSSGKVIVPPQYSSVSLFSEGLAAVLVGQKYGYIDNKGNMTISPQFDYAQDFKDGVAGVLINGKYGFIDKTGKVVIAAQYDMVGKFSEGLASACINNKWGFIDKDGKTVIGLNYEYVQDFSEGLAEASMQDKCYFIDKTGRPVDSIPRTGQYIPDPFNNGLAMVIKEEGSYYIDKSGKMLWKEPDSMTVNYGARLVKNVVRNEDSSMVIVYPQVQDLQDAAAEKKINSVLAADFNTNYRTNQDETFTVKYDVQRIQGDILNIIENSYSYYKGAAHGNPGRISIIINMKTGESYTLGELFKKDDKYIDVISAIIKKQVAEKQVPLISEFKNIDTTESFYLNDEGLVIYFPPYKYTPYAAGFVEFKIKYSELDDVLDKEGAFLKALNNK
jgi:hypothetical protein